MAYHEDWCHVWDKRHNNSCDCGGTLFDRDITPWAMPNASDLNAALEGHKLPEKTYGLPSRTLPDNVTEALSKIPFLELKDTPPDYINNWVLTTLYDAITNNRYPTVEPQVLITLGDNIRSSIATDPKVANILHVLIQYLKQES